MKISIKHNNDRDSFVCLPSPNAPHHVTLPPTPCATSSIYYFAVKSPLPLFLSLYFVFHASSIQKERFVCVRKSWGAMINHFSFEKCTPGFYLLQWPRYSNSMTTSLPPLLGPHVSLFPPTSHPAQCGLVSAPSTRVSSRHCLRPRACPLAGGIRSCHF